MIDVSQFLQATFTEANSTKRLVNPPGEYNAVIDKADLDVIQGVKDPSKSYLKLKMVYNLDSAELRAERGMDKVLQFDDFLLDMTDSGNLDFGKGKNVNLGKIREACGQNVAGQPWSFPMLVGQMVRVKITNKLFEGEPQAEVQAVTKAV